MFVGEHSKSEADAAAVTSYLDSQNAPNISAILKRKAVLEKLKPAENLTPDQQLLFETVVAGAPAKRARIAHYSEHQRIIDAWLLTKKWIESKSNHTKHDGKWSPSADIEDEIDMTWGPGDIGKKICTKLGLPGFSFGGKNLFFLHPEDQLEKCKANFEDPANEHVFTMLKGNEWEFYRKWTKQVVTTALDNDFDCGIAHLDTHKWDRLLLTLCVLMGYGGYSQVGWRIYPIPSGPSQKEYQETLKEYADLPDAQRYVPRKRICTVLLG